MLALAVSRHWPGTLTNVVDPRLDKDAHGGSHAPDPLRWVPRPRFGLATSDEPAALRDGAVLETA